jgi:hypothetical protein
MMTAGGFEGLEGGREPGGAGELGGTTREVAATAPTEGYGRPFAQQVEQEVERAAPRHASSSLGEVAGETGGPDAQAWQGPLP